jgi:multidrug resistance efflux pump
MMKFLAIAICTAVITSTIVLVDNRSVDFSSRSTAQPVAEPPTRIYASGVVEGSTEDIELLPEENGRVSEVLVRLGDWVEQGQVLLRIDDRSARAQVAFSLARLKLAQASVDRLVNGARESERQEARALLTAKRARLRQAMLTWQRVQTLRAQDAIAQQEADDQEGVFNTLSAEVDAAQARVDQLEAPAREDELRAAEARVAAAQADYETAQIALDRTRMCAPCRAQVIDLQIEPGEMISPGRTDPVVVLSDTSRTRVRAFVEEIDAPRVTVGVQAKISADGIPNETFDAVVRTISPRMEPKRVATDRPNELYDSKVREVLLEVAPSNAATRLIVGLRVDVLIAIDAADGLQTTHVVESVVTP